MAFDITQITNSTALTLLTQVLSNSSSSSSSNSISSLLTSVISGTSSTQTTSLSAVSLITAAGALTSGNPNSVLNTGDTDTLKEAVLNFVDTFNSAVDSLAGSENDITSVYADGLTGLAEANSDALASIGITIDDDGKLVVDETTLENAIEEDSSVVEDVFSSTSFTESVINKARSAISSSLGLTSGASFLTLYNNYANAASSTSTSDLLLSSLSLINDYV